MVQPTTAPHLDHTGWPSRGQPGRRLTTGRPDRGSCSASHHSIHRPGPQSSGPAPEDRGSVTPSCCPDQWPHPTALSFQRQMQGERRSPSSLWPRGVRLLSIPPAIRGQGGKMYTTVLLPPAENVHNYTFWIVRIAASVSRHGSTSEHPSPRGSDVGTPHNTRNGPFKVLQVSASLTNHRAVYSDQSQDSLFWPITWEHQTSTKYYIKSFIKKTQYWRSRNRHDICTIKLNC